MAEEPLLVALLPSAVVVVFSLWTVSLHSMVNLEKE